MSVANEVETGPIVEIDSGQLQGQSLDGVDSFKNIPFGADTVGANRFRPPQPVTPWSGIRPAYEFGPVAPQDPDRPDHLKGKSAVTYSEDCLNLNLWRPGMRPGDRAENLPVMVYIHGGGFSYGTANHVAHDGHVLAGRGAMVVVTISYRLGGPGPAVPCLPDGPRNRL